MIEPVYIDDLVDVEAPEMFHTRSTVPGKYLCGTEYPPDKPVSWGPSCDCVVCESFWSALSREQRDAIRRFWRG